MSGDERTRSGPLAGVRVIEIATILMAPYASQMLGDLGAEVVKVEDGEGDSSRLMGAGPHPQISGIALNLHRNKRSIVIDLEQPEGKQALRRLLQTADVLVTNMKPSSLVKLGIAYEQLKEDFPKLVYCEAHGFRSASRDADRPAFDDIIQALSGLPALNTAIGHEVAFLPVLLADKVAGMFMVQGVLAALLARASSGKGQRVEVPMFDAILAFNLVEHLSGGAVVGEQPGYSRILTEYRGPHRTKDGWIAMLPYTDKQWQALYDAAGCPERLDSPWHADTRTRLIRAAEVYSELKQVVAGRTTTEWIELCERVNIPVSRVPTLSEIVADPDLHRGVLREVDHPIGVRYRHIAAPLDFSESPIDDVASPTPLVGENTVAILLEAGLDATEIDELIARGAVTPAKATELTRANRHPDANQHEEQIQR